MTESWVRATLPGLADLAPVEHDQHGVVPFVRLAIPAADEDGVAWRCAVGLAARRLAGNPSRFAAWFGKLSWGQELAHDDAERMRVPLLVNVGEPGAEASEDHLVGLVAEALWYELTQDLDLGSGLPVLVEAHDWSVIDHGGDGLAIYRAEEDFSFRLWESKSHRAAGEIRDTVNGACRQLRDHAADYLGRFAVVSQRIVNDDDLARFICGMADEWADGSPAAGVGVCITASPDGDPTMCFERVPEYFEFEDDKHGGRLSVVADLLGFSKKIQRLLWRGSGLWNEP